MAYAAQLETPCTHCCLPALAATAPGLATQRHSSPASGSAPGSRPGAQVPLGDGPLLGPVPVSSDPIRRICTRLYSGSLQLHIAIRRLSLPSPPQEERYLLSAYCWLRLRPRRLANRHPPSVLLFPCPPLCAWRRRSPRLGRRRLGPRQAAGGRGGVGGGAWRLRPGRAASARAERGRIGSPCIVYLRIHS